MKKAILPNLLAILLLAALSSACPKNTGDQRADKDGTKVQDGATTPFTSAPKKIHDDDYGYSLVVPSDWKITQTQGNPVLFAEAPDAGTNGPLANVVIESVNQRMSPEDYLRANIITMQTSLPGLEIIDARVEVAAGVTMAWITFRFPRGNETVEVVSYCQIRDYLAFVVTGLSPAKDFPEYEETFRYIARSLRID